MGGKELTWARPGQRDLILGCLHADADGESRKPDSTHPTGAEVYCVPGPTELLSTWHLMHLRMDPTWEGLLNRDPGRAVVPGSGTEVPQLVFSS